MGGMNIWQMRITNLARMASKESQVAAQVRLNQWAQEIQDCQNRPKDMTVDEWCKQHNIKKANYYWRLRWM